MANNKTNCNNDYNDFININNVIIQKSMIKYLYYSSESNQFRVIFADGTDIYILANNISDLPNYFKNICNALNTSIVSV